MSIEGFKDLEQSGIQLGAQEVLAIDAVLQIGGRGEYVLVVAEGESLERTNASTGEHLSDPKLRELPNPGRNLYVLAQTVPSVIAVGDPTANRQQDQSSSSALSLSGGAVRANNYTIDGVSITDLRNRAALIPSVESVSDIHIETNPLDAEMGRTGGGVLTAVGKSGGIEWHGSAFFQSRPSWAAANNWFSNRAGLPLDRNVSYRLYGGSLGGPIRHDRSFFWFSTENYRQQTQSLGLLSVPTLLERRGDFSRTVDANGNPVTIYDPASTRLRDPANPSLGYVRDAFPGNVIPVERQNRVARALMNYWPEPDATSRRVDNKENYVRTARVTDRANQFTLKLDQVVSARLALSGMLAYQITSEPSAVHFDLVSNAGGGALDRTADLFAVNATYSASPRSVMMFRYGHTGFSDTEHPASSGFDVATLGFSRNFLSQIQYPKFPLIFVDEYYPLGDRSLSENYYHSHNSNVAIEQAKGRHRVKYGIDYRRLGLRFFHRDQGSGMFFFNRNFTQGPDPNVAQTTGGNALASMLLGYPGGGNMTVANPIDGYAPYYAGYFQNDFRMASRFVLNLGLRYEYEGGFREKHDRITVGFDPNVRSPLNDIVGGMNLRGGLIYAGVNGAPRAQGPGTGGLNPRAAFAWSAAPGLSVRGGYGLFYAPTQYTSPGNSTYGATGFSAQTTLFASADNGLTPAADFADPFPAGIRQPTGNSLGLLQQAGGDVGFVDSSSRRGTVQQYTLSMEHRFARGGTASVAYVGSRSNHMTIGGTDDTAVELNQLGPDIPLGSYLQQLVPNPFFGVSQAGELGQARLISQGQLLRPFPQFQSVAAYRVPAGFGRYNAMVLRFDKPSAGGGSFRVSYVWSKNLDNYFGENNFFANTSNGVRAGYDLADEYSYSVIDAPHRVIVAAVYPLPLGRTRSLASGRMRDLLIAGWTVSGIGTYQSGFPLQVIQMDNTSSFGGSQRPNRVGGIDAPTNGRTQDRLDDWINPAAFSAAPPYTFGNLARTIADIRTPSLPNLDVALSKTVDISERVRFTLRIEAANATNTPKFSGPNTTFGSSNFGRITSQAGTPRQVQWMARIHW